MAPGGGAGVLIISFFGGSLFFCISARDLFPPTWLLDGFSNGFDRLSSFFDTIEKLSKLASLAYA